MENDPDFYLKLKLSEMNQEQWESLCDRCGKCCYHKFITGRGKKSKVHFTRIACNLLDLKNGKCSDYQNRFQKESQCRRLTKNNIGRCDWLPETCAYRLLYYKQPLPPWHPLVSGNDKSVKEAGIMIENGVHQNQVNEQDWEDYEIQG